jgi:2-C-methyl-D-erythritol 4-phosphate cytidylyltransferase
LSIKNPGDSLHTSGNTAKKPRYFLVLPAAGSGQRMHSPVPKQYHTINGVPLLQLTLERVATNPLFSKVIIALAADDNCWAGVESCLSAALRNKLLLVAGGAERFHSVANALAELVSFAAPDDWILVHDVVRPCLKSSDIEKLVKALSAEVAGGLLAVPVRDTLKEGSDDKKVVRTLDRSMLWLAATPQMFRYSVLTKALEHTIQNARHITDEASAVEALGLPVALVAGRADNIKVTYPEDLQLAAAILQAEAASSDVPRMEF